MSEPTNTPNPAELSDRFFQAATGEAPAQPTTEKIGAVASEAIVPPAPPPASPPPAEEVPAGPPRDDRGRFASNSPAEAEASPEPAAASSETTSESAPEAEGPTTIEQLAREFDVDQEQFLNAVHVQRGEELVPLAEALAQPALPDGMDPETFTARQSQWETERQQAEQFIAQQAAQFNQNIEEISKAALSLQAKLNVGPTEADLARMKAEDPERYAEALSQRTEAEAAVRDAIEQVQRAQATQQQQQNQQHEAWLHRENESLLQKAPELRDLSTRQKTMTEVGNYLASQGFTKAEIDSIGDHRLVLLARKAMELEQLKKAAPKKREELAKLPKLTRTQARQPEVSPDQQVERDAWGRLSESGGTDKNAAQALFTNLVKRG